MTGALENQRVAFLVANEGVEQIELTEPWSAIERAGGTPVLVAPEPGTVQAFNHLDHADRFRVDETVADAQVDEFDALVLPGGVANPDHLRTLPHAVRFVREFSDAGKPIAAICHAPWMLVETGVLRDRTLTSWPSLKTDITNAGGEWIDEEVVIDADGPSTIVTSRRPADLPAFCVETVKAIAHARHAARRAS